MLSGLVKFEPPLALAKAPAAASNTPISTTNFFISSPPGSPCKLQNSGKCHCAPATWARNGLSLVSPPKAEVPEPNRCGRKHHAPNNATKCAPRNNTSRKPLHRGGNVCPPARTFQAITILQSEFRKFPLVITSSLRGECKTLQQYGQNLPLGDLLLTPK